MRQIYHCAGDVFVWLGEVESQEEPLFTRLSEALLLHGLENPISE